MAVPETSDEVLGFTTAWPLLAVGLGSLTIVGIVTLFMILKFVILPKRSTRVPTDET